MGGNIRSRERGSLVADRTGPATTYAMINLQERSTMLIPPGTEVYEGMIIGENSRAGDMEVNICREEAHEYAGLLGRRDGQTHPSPADVARASSRVHCK